MLEIAVKKQLGSFRFDAAMRCETVGITALYGRSGAGKTMLVNALAGLVTPDSGRIAIDGRVLFDADAGIDLPPERRRLGYVFQEHRLFPHLSVRANLTYGQRRAQRHGHAGGVSYERVVALLGLERLVSRRPRALSGGETQRVALGRALLANPRLLLMDEPLAALDQPRKDEILPFIERLRDDLAIPIVYVSHSMREIVRLADTLALVSQGRIVASGPLDEITSRLDLRPLTGRYEAGAVLIAEVERHHDGDGMSELRFPGGRLLVSRLRAEPGQEIRVRVRARDVALALAPQDRISILNQLPATVRAFGEDDGPMVDVLLDLGGAALWARITNRSRRRLALAEGSRVYALIKAVALDSHGLGRAGRGPRFLA